MAVDIPWNTILAVFGSVSGLGGAIVAGAFKHHFDAKMERLKADLSNRTHSSQAKFDKEIELYSKLMPAMLDMVGRTFWLFPQQFDHPPQDKEEQEAFYRKRLEETLAALNTSLRSLEECSVFMPEAIYDKANELYRLCKLQFDLFPVFGPMGMKDSGSTKVYFECMERTNEITTKYQSFVKELRLHIENLSK